jgi:peptidoglycan/LPS O-acetylase OafA/YrhL
MERDQLTKNLVASSALMTVLAGIIHLWIIPEHWAHAPAHGLFFLLVGIIQIVWGIAVWRNPSTRLYYIGVMMAGWLIVLFSIFAGFFTYGVARAAELIFPSLSVPAEEHHHDEGASLEEHHHDEVSPTPGHDH